MVLFFTSPIGLGHATRDIAIAQKLKSMSGTPIQFVSGESACWIIEKSGFPAIDRYRPEKFNVESGQLQNSFRWLLSYLSYYKKCKTIAEDIIIMDKNEKGRLIVSDEDFASIAVGEKANRKRILITDVTETHFTTGAAALIEKKMNKSMQNMMKGCNCVIIPDHGEDSENFRYVGPIVREAGSDRNSLRKKFGFDKNTIIVSVGGTDAGKYLIEKTIEAHKKIRQKLDSQLVIISGPSINLENSLDYNNLGAVDNLHEFIYASDLVISLAGRSTMDESIAYGTPGIFIPIKNHFEQEEGACRLGFRYEDVNRLESLIEEKILSKRNNATGAKGAEKAAKIIAALAE